MMRKPMPMPPARPMMGPKLPMMPPKNMMRQKMPLTDFAPESPKKKGGKKGKK